MPHLTFPHGSRPRKLHALALGLAIAWGALAPMAAHAVDPKAAKYYEDALVRYEKKDLDGAIIQLKNALQIDKDMLPVQMLLGKALLQNGDVVGAEVALTEALRLGVNRAEVVVPLGQAYLAQGKHKLVFEQPQFNLIGLPSSAQLQVLLLRATASSELGDVRAALKSIDEARAIDAKTPAVWLTEVPVRIRAHQLREAADAAERAIALVPNSAEAWYQKGSVQHVMSNLTGALTAYEQALKLSPDHMEAHIARAGIYVDLNRLAEASKDLDELARIVPDEPRAAYLRALLAERSGKQDVARAALKDVVNLIDSVPMEFIRYRPQLLMLNGLSHFGLNEREKAKQYLEAFQKAQGNTPASKLLAQIYIGESNSDRAIEVLETYLKAQPGDGQAMAMLGSALMAKGQNSRATSLMQRALEAKDLPQFHSVLGMSLLRSGQLTNAVKELETAFKGDSGQTQAATSLIGLYLRSGQGPKAVSIAESLVKQQPSNADFFNLLGISRKQSGDMAGAKTAFEQAVKLNDQSMQPKLNLARLDIAQKSYASAKSRLDAILAKDEKNAEALFEMAVMAERQGSVADAQRWLEKTNDLSGPREIRWGLALSDFHLRYNHPPQALEAVKRVSARAPDDLAVLMTYARAQLAVGDVTGAKSTLTNATKVADYNAPLQVQIALLQIAANNLGGAAYCLEKALSTAPDFLPALALMAEVELRQSDPVKSEKRARDIVTRYPQRAIGYSLQGDVAASRNQYAAAMEFYRKAHETEPSTETFLRLFRFTATRDNEKSAIPLAERWLKNHPNDTAARKALGDGYARSGNFARAKATYEAVLKVSPDDGEALNNLANVLLRLKDPATVKTAEMAVSKNPGNANSIDTLGWALFQAGQFDRALQMLRDARLREPGNAEIRYHLAVALAKAGRQNEAKDELEAALKSGQAFEDVADAQALLKSLR